ncbi:MAG: type II secretion system F family protein [Candidatus Pacebacteria bacterium]|nr:type II secretion system F family protein [Candidatus Paceibacterota bacterium]
MPFYKYTAKNEHAETVKGKVEAQNKSQAVQVLKSRDLFVVNLLLEGEGSFTVLSSLVSGVKYDDIVNFTRQLSTMITAGLPLTEALSILEQQGKPAVVKVISELLKEIEGGSTFAKALEKFPKHFTKVYTQLVRAGETAGVLDEVLQRLAENMEKDKEFKAKTKGALIYPAIVMLAMMIVGTIMMVVVVPKLTDMYKDFGAELPGPTQFLIDLSGFVKKTWYLQIVFGVAGFFGMKQWTKTRQGAIQVSTLKFKIPIYGKLTKKVILTEMTRTMSLLLSAGISLLQVLEIVTEASSSALYQEELKLAAKKVEKGVSFAQTLTNQELFPIILSQMASVGEETGKLDEVLLKISSYFQSESEHEIKNLTTALEPFIMIILAIGVGFMTIAIIMPIYSLTSQF